MIALLIILICVVAVILLFLFSIAPNTSRRGRMKPYEERYIAHRGLYDNNGDAPENSMLAYQRAIDAGYGIELDVQMTTDEQLVIFHDESLERMCGVDKIFTDCSYAEIKDLCLANSEAHMPMLADALALIDGKVPLIVEIKSGGDWRRTTELTAKMLDGYNGLYCMESFHPFIVRWFKKNRPEVMRGQLATNFYKEETVRLPKIISFLLTNMMADFLSRPDFIAYNYVFKNHWGYRICRRLFKVVNAAWTIQSREELDREKRIFDIMIFDSFRP